jgi:hypothetical protein
MNPDCVCGTTKDVIHLIAVRSHCDGIECKQGSGCAYCRRYNARTNYRVADEHAREKQTNG